MKQPKKKIDYKEHETSGSAPYPNLSNVASANECTGLMYAPPQNQEEMEAYQRLSSMEIPRDTKNGRPEESRRNSPKNPFAEGKASKFPLKK